VHSQKRLRGIDHADVVRAREDYATRRGANLRYVLRKRFSWMQRYLGPDTYAVEVGCGAGFSPLFLHAGRIELTDAEPRPWVDRVVDAHALPHDSTSIDALIANNVIHHLAFPDRFFREATRVLKPGGYLLIQECDCALTTRVALRLTGHEGYDFSADPFDPSKPCNDAGDPWSANCAIPNLLFDDLRKFAAHYPDFEVVDSARSEFFLHFNSGGVSSRTPYVPLPEIGMRVVDAVDAVLVRLVPSVFSSQRRVVLRRR
jgi:SAM-dependent methyltransferase